MEAIDFPVWTNGTISAHGYNHTPDLHVPVRIGGIMIYPNNLLHADRNGVTTIPTEIAAEVADIGDAFIAAENIILEAVRREGVTVQTLRDALAQKDAQVAAIYKQVSRART